ncbi:MAG: glycosyltransferase [Acidobacteriaceae bacterium]|nr:glycosyltransferase [Acidobacteriaceae bacterium]
MAGLGARRGLIAHILPFDEIGGTELQTLRLAQAAESIGFESIMYCPKGAAEVERLFRSESFRTEVFEPGEPSYRRPGPFWRCSQMLAQRLKEDGVDVIHGADLKGAHHAGLAGRLAGARVLCHVRNSYPKISLREQGFLLPVHEFIFVSRAVKSTLDLPKSRKAGPVIYDVPAANGSSVFRSRREAREHFGLPVDALVVGTAARLAPQKDYETLIRAAGFVLDRVPNVKFLVAGDIESGEHRKYYNGLLPILAETKTAEAFRFAGFQTDMSWLYGASDAIVLSSHWEGLGTVLLEAMLNKKPIVATEINGLTELVIQGKTGLLAPPRSPEVMGNYLIEVLTNKEKADQLVSEGTRYFAVNFGTERFVREIDALYSRQIKTNSRSGIVAEVSGR